jgi:hypothetical protein
VHWATKRSSDAYTEKGLVQHGGGTPEGLGDLTALTRLFDLHWKLSELAKKLYDTEETQIGMQIMETTDLIGALVVCKKALFDAERITIRLSLWRIITALGAVMMLCCGQQAPPAPSPAIAARDNFDAAVADYKKCVAVKSFEECEGQRRIMDAAAIVMDAARWMSAMSSSLGGPNGSAASAPSWRGTEQSPCQIKKISMTASN